MSIHKSLKIKSGLVRARNVLSRLERINKLEEQEKWSEKDSIFKLPKVLVKVAKKRAKKKKEETDKKEEKK